MFPELLLLVSVVIFDLFMDENREIDDVRFKSEPGCLANRGTNEQTRTQKPPHKTPHTKTPTQKPPHKNPHTKTPCKPGTQKPHTKTPHKNPTQKPHTKPLALI